MSNKLPEGWKESTLGYFADINPKIKSNVKLTKDTKVSFIKMEDVSNDAKVTKKHVRNYSEVAKGFTKFNNNDVLVAKITPCFENGKGGYVDHLVNGIGFGSTEFHVLRATKVSNSQYLYQYTNYDAFRLEAEASMCGTGGQRRVQTEFMKTYKISYPPLPEQQKIAAILTSVDDVIEKTQAQINKLKDLKTGMMQELLTCGVGVDGKPHTEFKDSPVGRIPKGWDVVTLKNITNRITDGTHQSVKTSDDGVHPFLYVSCIKKGQIQWEKASYLSNDEYEKASKGRKPIIGDILYSAVGSYGNAAVVTKKLEFSFQRHIAYIQPNNTIIDSFFLAEYLNSQIGKKQADFYAIGNAQLSVTLGDLGKFQILLPPLVEQRKIVSLINSIDLKICCAEEKNAKNKAIKKALMQDLLTGKVRVNVD